MGRSFNAQMTAIKKKEKKNRARVIAESSGTDESMSSIKQQRTQMCPEVAIDFEKEEEEENAPHRVDIASSSTKSDDNVTTEKASKVEELGSSGNLKCFGVVPGTEPNGSGHSKKRTAANETVIPEESCHAKFWH